MKSRIATISLALVIVLSVIGFINLETEYSDIKITQSEAVVNQSNEVKSIYVNSSEDKVDEGNTSSTTSPKVEIVKPSSDNNSSNVDNGKSSVNESNTKTDSTIEIIEPKDESVIISIIGLDTILGATSVEYEDGDSVADVLKRVAELNNISLDITGFGMATYVSGINGLKELQYGGESGWMYKVNGSFPSKSCGSYTLSDGDTIEWLYTRDGGKDIGSR